MKILDLTMNIDKRTPVFPGDQKQVISKEGTIKQDGFNKLRLTFNSHFSTHIDVPFHMIKNGKNLSDFPIESFIGKAIVIDLSSHQQKTSGFDSIKEDDIVFLYTGQTEKAYSEKFYKDYPVISEKTAKTLVNKKIRIVGIDSFTVDLEPFTVHKIFLKSNIPIVENLVNLKSLCSKRFECTILPLKIKDADGAPCRVIARL